MTPKEKAQAAEIKKLKKQLTDALRMFVKANRRGLFYKKVCLQAYDILEMEGYLFKDPACMPFSLTSFYLQEMEELEKLKKQGD